MRKLLFAIVALLAFWACSNEDLVQNPQIPMDLATKALSRATETGLSVDEQVIFLQDSTNRDAGRLFVTANVPEVSIQWNVTDSCNLDTTRTYLTMSNGSAYLDIKWDKMQDDGRFAPAATAFDNGILLSDGTSSIYVHLVLTKDPDIANYSDVMSRSVMEAAIMPRAVGINARPTEVKMSEQKGGLTVLSTTGAAPVILTFDQIGSYTNLDLSTITDFYENDVTNQLIRFNWDGNGAPDTDFSSPFTIFGIDNNLTAEVLVSFYKQNAPSLTVTPNTFEVESAGATVTAKISTNQTKWELQNIKDIPDWITYNTTTGNTGISGINLTIAPNTTMQNRYATLIIKAGAIQRGIDITQLGITPSLEVSPTLFNVKREADLHAVTVTSNTTWRVTTNADWLDALKTTGSNNETIVFATYLNPTNERRVATATVSTAIGTVPVIRTITFIQEGLTPTLEVSPTSFPNIKSEGESASVSVTSNVAWSVTTDAAWLNANTASGNGNASIAFTVAANSADASRTATATITATAGATPITRTITFTQQAKVATDYIEIGGVKWAKGNLCNGQISTSPNAISYQWNSGYYYNWNSNNPQDYKTIYNSWSDQRDPCPSGWKTPTEAEASVLVNSNNLKGYYGNVIGIYCNTNTVPSLEERDNYLFLPISAREENGNVLTNGIGLYWTREKTIIKGEELALGFCVRFNSVSLGWNRDSFAFGGLIRCVKK